MTHRSPLWPSGASKYSAPRQHDFARLRANLTARYGPDRAGYIIAGQDLATNTDLQKWRTLGAQETP